MDSTVALLGIGAFAAGAAGAYGVARGRVVRAMAAARSDRDAAEESRARTAATEPVLRIVVDAAPMALVLVRGSGISGYANVAARELLFDDRAPEGENLLSMLDAAPAPFREALVAGEDALFSLDADGEAATYHLARRSVPPDLTLITVRDMTRELRQQEVAAWKRLLRIISHELNNSLAPIASMAHSGRMIIQTPGELSRLDRVFSTIEERATHLAEFLDGYATLARLPRPRRTHVLWSRFLAHVAQAWPDIAVSAPPPGTGYFDGPQIEQVLVNLLKNAQDAAGNHEISLDVARAGEGWTICVRDRGPGMSDEVLANALLPFYSTKQRGSGIGLAICREIVEAHGGKVRLQNREGGGLEAALWIPDTERPAATTSRLTISRA